MKQSLHRLISFILLLMLAAACYGGLRFYAFMSTPASDAPREFVLSIASGSGFDRVAYDLQKEGAVTDVDLFRMLARLKGSLNRVQAGDYLISTGWTPDQVLRQITEGKALLYRLSVREGLTWWETAAAVEQQGFARFEDFRDVIRDPQFLREHNIPFADAEGFLFPETYLLPKPRTPLDREQAWATASHMVGMFWKKTQALWSDPSFMKKSAVSRQGDASATAAGANGSPAGEVGTDTKVVGAVDTDTNATGTVTQTAGTVGAVTKVAGSTGVDINAGCPAGADRSAAGAAGGEQNSPSVLPTPVPPEGQELPAGNARTPQEPGAPAVAAPPASPANGPRSPAEIDEDALRRLVILASLVEKETGLPGERGPVAGVFANRLRLGMLLQCDPTIVYGIGESFRGRIRRAQIEDEKNPYNTYRHAGLPPGPICSPGLEALKAAFAPTDHDFLFFVARDTGAGHNFSKTLDEHNRAVQLYRARPRAGNTP
ncbi:MAG: endolytic transglycosylase MltG [Desulfovibrio sp.]|jgi:cell division protein YceG involved in septum cleavage|nr:endolytic transglycosylase MltG [Desulfovibrio sp.]